MSVNKAKELLSKYKREDIEFNEPKIFLISKRRHVSKKEIEENLLDPLNLRYAFKMEERFDGEKWELFFIDKNRILQIPVVFRPKSLYVITIIKRLIRWERMIKKWKKSRQI